MAQHTKISATAHYVPEKKVSNDDFSQITDTSDEWIKARTGIANRRIATIENTSDLCIKVAQFLLKKGKISANELDFILIATMTPDYLMPSTASLVQGQIGALNAFALDILAACSGFVYALALADKLICSHAYKKGLVIGGEVVSKLLDWNDRSTFVLFGDGAGGVLLTSDNKSHVLAEKLQTDGLRADALTAGELPLHSPYSFSKKADSYLKMAGREIFDFAIRDIPKNISAALQVANLDVEDIDYYLLHQANIRIIDKIAKKLNIPRSKFLTNIEKYGNTSAASIPILLDEAVSYGILNLGSGQKVMLTGFGGGLTWGSMLISL
ncbi:MAG: ketoacyl-ACP synthase III [Streptococcaceae bacterium]|jgi:3-oxoacyl-[acyl-carrier-protein] synthase-3|nr:ketoacyl-ACP synthase III [Streptococcaceae bacterium]